MATLFWVGGSTAYDGVTNRLATTTGGTATVAVIAAGDTVTFDANSPAAAAVTTTAAISCTTFSLATGFTGSLTLGNTLTVSGTMSFIRGTFNTGNQTCSFGSFGSNTAGTRVFTFGTSTINCAGNWTVGQTGQSGTISSSIINMTGTSAVFSGGTVLSYGTINFTGPGTQSFSTTSNVTNCSRVSTGGIADTLNLQGNLTCSGTFTVTGTATSRVLVVSSSVGTARTISAASLSLTNANFMDITGAGAATWSGTSMGDAGGNTNITFDAPVDQHWISANGGNWNDVTKWTSRIPLPQDNVIFDGAFNSGQTVTTNTSYLGANMDWSSATWTGTRPVLSGAASTVSSWFGSFILAPGMVTGSIAGNGWRLCGRNTSFDINSQGIPIGPGLTITAPGATYNQRSSYQQSNSSGITNGSYKTNGFNMTVVTSWTVSGAANMDFSTSTFTNTSTSTGSFTISSTGTIVADQATFVFNSTSVGSRIFAGGGNVFGTLTYTAPTLTGPLSITGANKFGTINFSNSAAANTITFPASTTTVIGVRNIFGTSGKLMTVNSSTPGTPATLVSGRPWLMGANSVNVSGNSGLTFAGGAEMDYLSVQDINGNQTISEDFFRLM